MTALDTIMVGTMATAALSGIMLAHRRVEHRPAAVALVLLAASNVVRGPLNAALSPHPVAPWEGVKRLLVYLDGARVLGEAAIVPGLALAVCVSPERRRVAVAAMVGVWAVASVVVAALYPSPLVRGEGLRLIYLGVDVVGLAVAALAFASWARTSERSPGSEHGIALALIGLDLVILLGPASPWRFNFYGGSYDVTQLAIAVFFATFTIAQGIVWTTSRR